MPLSPFTNTSWHSAVRGPPSRSRGGGLPGRAPRTPGWPGTASSASFPRSSSPPAGWPTGRQPIGGGANQSSCLISDSSGLERARPRGSNEAHLQLLGQMVSATGREAEAQESRNRHSAHAYFTYFVAVPSLAPVQVSICPVPS